MTLGACLVLAVAVEGGVYLFTKHRGVAVTGDEPHYLVLARALTHFSPLVLWAYRLDLRTHYFFPWPAGTTTNSPSLHTYAGPHGVVSVHGLGVGLMLAPGLALGGKDLAFLGFFAIEAAGFIYIHQRASWLAGLSLRGKVLFGLALAGPAVWIAGTQIYPDLCAGIFLACALVEVAVAERRGQLGVMGGGVFALTMAFLPWLHVKNLLPAIVTCLALAVVLVRVRQIRGLLIVGGIVAVSWILFFTYNQFYFGHLLGLPQATPALNKATFTQTFGLLFDRDQGLVVQLPTILLGVAGLWLARRKLPIAVTGTVLAVFGLILLNGTYTSVPYGGGALAGRFEWSAMPALGAWCPPLIARIAVVRARAWALGGAIVVLWVAQGIPILANRHSYYNAQNPTPPWDPSTYPGWWSRLDRVLPEFRPGRLFGQPWFSILVEVVIVVAALAALLHLGRTSRLRSSYLAATGVIVVGAVGLAWFAHPPGPSRPLLFTGADVGAPLSGTTGPKSGPTVPLQAVDGGTYEATLTYTLTGSGASASMTLVCSPGTALASSAFTSSAMESLSPAAGKASVATHCGGGTLWFQLTAGASSRLGVTLLELNKTSG